jgi:hypothetical protein
MTSIATRTSVLAIKPEVTEGTPVAPAAAGDFIAMQDDFDISPEFEKLENLELKSSLGRSKPILGMENPSVTFSHYIRHSGVEGQAPNYKELLEALFGTETVNGTEYDLVAGSTVSVVNVDTDEGANFARGQAMLFKDATNGYSIRPIHSISTDAITLGFDLSDAPAATVNTGKAVTYSPADSGHQSLSIWSYLGNSGAVELVSGARVTSADITFEAGQLINCNYSLSGIEYFFNPMVVTSSNKYLDMTTDNDTYAVAIPEDTYKDPHELAAAIQTAIAAADTDETLTCVYDDSTGKFTLATSTSAVLEFDWKTGTHGSDNTDDHIGTLLGFADTADDTGATTYTSDTAIDLSAPYTPSYDDSDPLAAKANECFIGDHDDNSCFAASSVSINISDVKRDINSICATSGKSGSIINAREAEITVTALLQQYEADKFRKFRENENTRFMYNFGTKTAGNWDAGKCGCIYVPDCTITSFNLSNDDGLIALEMTLQPYVDSDGNGEIYLSFV